MSRISHRVDQIKPSATITVSMKAMQLKAQGKDIVSLGFGEPDFDTPEHIREAAIAAILEGKTRYTQVDGTPELKQAIIEKFHRDNQKSMGQGHQSLGDTVRTCSVGLQDTSASRRRGVCL